MSDNPGVQNPVELLDIASEAEQEATAAVGGALKGVAEFKLAIGLIEAAVVKIDQKTALGVGVLSGEVNTGIGHIQEEANQALKKIRDEMRDPMNQAELASQIRNMLDRIGF